jgi:hypothetical protein
MSHLAPDTSITDLEAAKLMLDEWKFRQLHCWSSLQHYGLAAVTVSIAPYLKSDLFAQLGKLILVFPIVGWLLSVAAAWLFAAEYVRCHPIAYKYQKLLDKHEHYRDKPPLEGWKRALGKRIGWTTVYIFFFGFTGLSILNAIMLWMLQARLLVGDIAK